MDRCLRLLAALTLASLAVASCGSPAPPSPTPPSPPEQPDGTPSVATTAMPSPTPVAPSPAPAAGRPTPDPNSATLYPRDPTAPARLPGTTHAIELVIAERNSNVADAVVREVWTYGGTVPGPVIRVRAGDTLRIHLVNDPPPSLPQVELMHPPVNDHPHSVGFPCSAHGLRLGSPHGEASSWITAT
jgi:nitrite reductase (NO-forming)